MNLVLDPVSTSFQYALPQSPPMNPDLFRLPVSWREGPGNWIRIRRLMPFVLDGEAQYIFSVRPVRALGHSRPRPA